MDDQVELAELIQAVLEGDGHAVEVVHGGQAALERLGQAVYDLVVCDLQMPDVDGARSSSWRRLGRPCSS